MRDVLAENVDEKGILKIRSLVARYCLEEFLEAVYLEVLDLSSNDFRGHENWVEANRVRDRLERLVGFSKDEPNEPPIKEGEEWKK